MPREENRRRLYGFFCSSQAREEKFEAIGTVEQHDIYIIMRVIEHIDILIHEHVSLLFFHLMQMACEGVETMDTDTLIMDENPLRMAWLREEMNVQLVLEPLASVRKFRILIIMVTNNSKMFELAEASEEFSGNVGEILEGEMLRMTIRRHEIATMKHDGILFCRTSEEHLDTMRSLMRDSIDTPTDMRIREEEK